MRVSPMGSLLFTGVLRVLVEEWTGESAKAHPYGVLMEVSPQTADHLSHSSPVMAG
jgi:hypothetical protein